MSTGTDVEVADWGDCLTLNNVVGPGSRPSNSDEKLECGSTVGDIHVPGPEFDVETRGHAGRGECGLGDAAKSSTSAAESTTSDEVELIHDK